MRSFSHISSLVKKLRIRNGMSQEQVGILVGLSGHRGAQYISNIERGFCSVPIKRVVAFSRALKVSPLTIRQAMIKDYGDSISDSILKQQQ